VKKSKWLHWGTLWLIAFIHFGFLLISTFMDGFMSGDPDRYHHPLRIWAWSLIISTLLIWFINYGKNLMIKVALQFVLMLLFRQVHDIQYFYIDHTIDIKYGYWVNEPTEMIQFSYVLAVIITILLIVWSILIWLNFKKKK
jgi:hypothetical protein